MRMSVVVVNWNGRAELDVCLGSLAAQSHAELEVIVVDNGSTDGSVELVREGRAGTAVTLIEAGENLGFAEGCNRGIRASHAEWVCMLNNDAVADPRWAESLAVAAGRVGARCGMLQSLMLYQARPGIINSTGIELNTDGGGSDRWEGRPRPRVLEPAEIFCPTAGAAAYRRAMLEEVALGAGYFDAAHFLYFEDMDLGWRARLAGWSAMLVPEAVVHHRWHGSSNRHGTDRLRVLVSTNRFRTLAKNASAAFVWGARGGCLSELRQLWRSGGISAVAGLGPAIHRALADRRHVDRLRRVERRQLEQRWARG
ncbi:MAG: glycosyltransferase family 2 protein [Thermoanaerobaculaceae bacterium]|jgi:hypothetical protein|nr:glycosyltransferase family 2 protein [Thermoanaerobaculaceae bacterium]